MRQAQAALDAVIGIAHDTLLVVVGVRVWHGYILQKAERKGEVIFMPHYQQHVFFCTNQKPDGRTCCAAGGGANWCAYAKTRARALDLPAQGVRISGAGCLGRCEEGPNVVIYPQGVWYRCQSEADVELILQQHVIAGETVSQLLLDKA